MIIINLLSLFLITIFANRSGANQECGISSIQSRIFRGAINKPHQYPWLVYIQSHSSEDYNSGNQCGGSLISDRLILTAAHCLVINNKPVSIENVDVLIGIHSLVDQPEVHTIRKYKIPNEYFNTQIYHDIAILELTNPVKFSNKIYPICLPPSHLNTNNLIGQKMIISGWGASGQSIPHSPGPPRSATVYYMRNYECDYRIKKFAKELNFWAPKISDKMVCAVNPFNQADTCKGDSGGPLMYFNSNDNRWYLMGIVSGSPFDCDMVKNFPGVYTNVASYMKFIENYR